MTIKHLVASSVAALLVSTSANAQMFGEEYGTDLDYDRFSAGLGGAGTYTAWERDDQEGLSQGEFATGMFSDWDRDNDMQISEEEYGLAAPRWYGADYATPFSDYDADASGYIDRQEFGGAWDNAYYDRWDTDMSGSLSEDEFGTGLYGAADADQDKVITIQEEGWFEGWFDGDDIEAEIEEVGDVL